MNLEHKEKQEVFDEKYVCNACKQHLPLDSYTVDNKKYRVKKCKDCLKILAKARDDKKMLNTFKNLSEIYSETNGWHEIDGFPNYRINIDGVIVRLSKRSNKAVVKNPILTKHGYVYTKLSYNYLYKGFLLHRLIAKTFIPNPENKPEVNHKDGCKTNNSISNLEWCTRQENIIHAVKNGLQRGNIKMKKNK